MKSVPAHILTDLAGRFGYAVDALAKLGGGREDSDGITYHVSRNGAPYVLKIVGASAENPNALEKVRERAGFFAYLGEHGVDVVTPQPNAQGRLIESAVEGPARYIAYQYPYMTGSHPTPDLWTDEMVSAWGYTIGETHRLTQKYHIWNGISILGDETPMLSWREEVNGFTDWCEDEDVKAVWHGLGDILDAMPYERETGGFIHNDPHMQNILWEDGRVKLLDFDVAACHFFAADLAIAIQSVLFTKSGGMDRPVGDRAALDWFVGRLLEGYAKAQAPDPRVLDAIGLFIDYRRALLFTVMQGWLAGNPDARAGWKRMIQEPPRIINP